VTNLRVLQKRGTASLAE